MSHLQSRPLPSTCRNPSSGSNAPRWRKVLAAGAFLLAAGPLLAQNLSGGYLGGNGRLVLFLQLSQSDAGQLSGRLRQADLGPDGAFREADIPLSGTANNGEFVGKLERSWAEGGSSAISGQLSAGGLKVSGANGLRAQLRRGDESSYVQATAALRGRGAKVAQESAARAQSDKRDRALSDSAAQMGRLNQAILDFSQREPRTVQRLSAHSQTYDKVSARMGGMLDDLRATTGNSAEDVSKRSSLGASMLHSSIEAQHAHIEVMLASKDLEATIGKLSGGLAAAKKVCGDAGVDFADAPVLRQTCAPLASNTQVVQRTSEEVRQAYRGLEDAWQRARVRQVKMLQEAQALQRQYDRRARG